MVRVTGLLWDEEAENHIAGHGITLEEVEEAVTNGLYSRRSREYILLIGQTAAGRYLTIVLDDEGEGFWYPVTARDSSQAERRLIKRQAALKG